MAGGRDLEFREGREREGRRTHQERGGARGRGIVPGRGDSARWRKREREREVGREKDQGGGPEVAKGIKEKERDFSREGPGVPERARPGGSSPSRTPAATR